jgi:hypothetical protein
VVDHDHDRINTTRRRELTKSATVDIFLDIGAKAWPPVVVFDKFFCFKMAGVACCGVVMESAEEVMPCGRGNISVVFVIQDGVNNFPV